MKKVMVVFGTRPEAIKMCPLVKELKSRESIETIVCVTSQHREQLDQVLEVFDIKPDYDLNIMKHNQTLSDITSNVLVKLDEVLKEVTPDLVLVHGDTTTTFSASLAAYYNQIKVGHVEAGLRTYNKYSPFPEEINRKLTGAIADVHFAPTTLSRDNLLKESYSQDSVYVTGNTVIDSMKYTISDSYTHEELEWASDSRLILLTAHRRENLGEPMRNIFKAIRRIVEEFSDVKVVYPVHLNPKVREIANEILDGIDRVHLIEPLDVFGFHNFMNKSYLILTDSGGIQEEAPSLGKPVLVLRDTTERPEGVEVGTLKLVGTAEQVIYDETKALLLSDELYSNMSNTANPYGDGTACAQIATIIENNF